MAAPKGNKYAVGNNGGSDLKKIPFDIDQFEEMCHIQCTETEMAAVLKMSVDTLERRIEEHYGKTFAEVFTEKREFGKRSLRRAQWKKATESNDTTMQIFLGKNILGQKDKHEIEVTDGINIVVKMPEKPNE